MWRPGAKDGEGQGSDGKLRLGEKKLASRIIYSGKIINLRLDDVELPDGKLARREVVEYSGAVAVTALTSGGELVLVRQYRYPIGKESLEIPAGKIESGEDPLSCARRELREETGAEAAEWEFLCRFYSTPGFCTEEMHLYLARNLEFKGQQTDEDEFIQVEKVPLEQCLEMIASGVICDAKSIIGVLTVSKGESK